MPLVTLSKETKRHFHASSHAVVGRSKPRDHQVAVANFLLLIGQRFEAFKDLLQLFRLQLVSQRRSPIRNGRGRYALKTRSVF
ncbi:MAG: hypothetical protein U0894_11075 [Pirellulales bacterium]